MKFQLPFFSKTPTRVGIDRGTRQLKAVRIRQSGDKFYVEDAFQQSKEGDYVGPLKEELKKRRFTKLPAAISFSDENTERHEFSLPTLEKKELESAVDWELRKILASSLVHDTLIYPKDQGFDVECVVTSREKALQVYEEAKTYGINPVYLETEGEALVSCLRAMNPDEAIDQTAIIDLAHGAFRIIFIHRDRISFTRPLYFGLGSLFAQVAATSEVTLGEVLACNVPAVQAALEKGIQEICYNLAEEFRRSEVFLTDKKSLEGITTIYLAGGGANLKTLPLALLERLQGKKIEILDPWKVACSLPSEVDPNSGPLWAVSVGLAYGR